MLAPAGVSHITMAMTVASVNHITMAMTVATVSASSALSSTFPQMQKLYMACIDHLIYLNLELPHIIIPLPCPWGKGETSRFTVVSRHPTMWWHLSAFVPDFIYAIFPTVFLRYGDY